MEFNGFKYGGFKEIIGVVGLMDFVSVIMVLSLFEIVYILFISLLVISVELSVILYSYFYWMVVLDNWCVSFLVDIV